MTRVAVYLSLGPASGGAYQYSLSIVDAVAALPRDRYVPVVVCAREGWREVAAVHELEIHDAKPGGVASAVEYAWRKAGLPLGFWRTRFAALDSHVRALRRLNVDLWIYPAQDPMAYMLPQPALAVVHDLMHRYEPDFPEVSGYRMRERHYRATCQYASGILVESEAGKRQLIESYGVSPDRVHPLNLIPPSYIHATHEPDDLTERYPLPPKFFFYPAQFWMHKNHVRLLHAAARIRDTCPDIQFVFVGARKNGFENLVAAANRLNLRDRVHILGYLPNEYMAPFYRRARALVMPTFFGPTNIPPLEAMAVGCPIAISGTYGMPEQCGDAAIYFDPMSVDEIATCLSRLWTDDALCRSLSAHGRARAQRNTPAAFNARLCAIVDAVAARGPDHHR